ncbi:nicotinate-nucleotide adenylyltransferase [Fictibacillus iocasae]|uniref:Probable nicotinate-nucleotide adenylyltransferase n=1 Tax=Fictibacillus iocasae TaxID=2715437 RepID=A0ABW2NTX0_9BACL
MRKTGIFGGSFNPPHTGHLIIAQEALHQLKLDRVVWVPAKKPPHKKLAGNATDQDRAEMVRLAIEGNRQFGLSLIEFDREGPSYTIDTVKQLLAEDQNQEITFIMGGDMVSSLSTWKKIEELREIAAFAGVRRKDSPINQAWQDFGVKMIDVPLLEISSTFIRNRRKDGGNVRYYIPPAVLHFMEEKGLYGQNSST